MKTFVLSNPRGLVTRAAIHVLDAGKIWLSVDTLYTANNGSMHNGLSQAKNFFGREYLSQKESGKHIWTEQHGT